MVTLIAALSRWVFTATPQSLGQHPDGEAVAASTSAAPGVPERVPSLRRDRAFLSLAAGMALGLSRRSA